MSQIGVPEAHCEPAFECQLISEYSFINSVMERFYHYQIGQPSNQLDEEQRLIYSLLFVVRYSSVYMKQTGSAIPS